MFILIKTTVTPSIFKLVIYVFPPSPIEKLKEEQELEKKLFQQNAEILQETGMEEGSSLLQPVSSQTQDEGEDEDDNLKMNIKIFRVSPPNKHKTKHTRNSKEDLVEVETQITLEEEAGEWLISFKLIFMVYGEVCFLLHHCPCLLSSSSTSFSSHD